MESTTTQAPANRTPILALLTGNAISLVGSMMTTIALPWFVLQTTGSAAKTGLTGFFVALPYFLTGVFGGTIVDRLGFKRTSVIADTVSGVGVAMVPLLYHTVGLAFWQLLTLVFVASLLSIPGLTARRSLLPELATLAHWRLERVNASFEGIQFLSMLIGPPVAGLMIAVIGASNVLWFDAASFFISALIVTIAIPRALTGTAQAATGRYWNELRAGLRFLRDDRVLLALAISLALTNFLYDPYFGLILPVFAKRTYNNATALGVMVAAIGGGQIVGATIYGAIGHRLPRRAVWIGGYIVTALPIAIVVLITSLPVIVVVLGVTAIAGGALNPLLVTIRHERIPTHLRGRVFSTFTAIAQVAQPLGLLLIGNLIEGIGFRPTVLAVSAGILMISGGMFFIPALHELDMSRSAVRELAQTHGGSGGL